LPGGLSGLSCNNDLAFVIDPFGTVGSEAMAGFGNNFDLAGVFGDGCGDGCAHGDESCTGPSELVVGQGGQTRAVASR
jgi:hypothetical protein